ncbi:DMT family transporter [Flavobacterium urocaniciphilum]|uniref:Permease of the drug/metabolite transporter (DMT) superfamily n=1 Tax=Flavobacterium urocaniciphilum TaxID=1299341 RepID=A0A1H9AJM7_9FLAO|nr:EamA family transporter [Flavobacterium urocaniciphilum]SEP76930.1 Permease of the drug/metabolite transporter (DMT) superfamily [Flavobacterium urocaniciphilum]
MPKSVDIKLIISMIIVGLVWGTTFLGISIAVDTIPPWYSTAIRNFVAALIVFFILLFTKKMRWIGRKGFYQQTILSVLMLVFANGFTTVAELTLPSGLTSIISAINPVVIFLMSIVFQLQKPNLKGFVGVLLGFSGVVFIFKDGLSEILNPDYKTGVAFLSLAILSWAFGTIYSKKLNLDSNNLLLNLFYQFLIASIIQIILSFIIYPESNIESWSLKSFGAVIYLAVFGSVIALFSYQYALKKVSPIQVSILSYVNTIIAVFLGWYLNHEVVKKEFIIAVILIIIGVFVINYKKKK